MRNYPRAFALPGLAALAFSAWFGLYQGQQDDELDIWCGGQSVQQLPSEAGVSRWLLTRFSFDFAPNGSGLFRVEARLLGDQQQQLGQLLRRTTFSYRRLGPRLQLKVEHDDQRGNDDLSAQQLPGINMALLQLDAALGYRIRRLEADTYLLDNGVGLPQLCRVMPEQPALAWPRAAGATAGE